MAALFLSILFCSVLLWKTRSIDINHKIVKFVIIFTLIYVITWSFFNWLFYANLIILHIYFNYPMKESVFIAINLTDTFSTGFFYSKLYFKHFIGWYNLSSFLDGFEKAMQPMVDQYNNLSDMETITNILFKVLPFI